MQDITLTLELKQLKAKLRERDNIAHEAILQRLSEPAELLRITGFLNTAQQLLV
jgi:hypothetical protein